MVSPAGVSTWQVAGIRRSTQILADGLGAIREIGGAIRGGAWASSLNTAFTVQGTTERRAPEDSLSVS